MQCKSINELRFRLKEIDMATKEGKSLPVQKTTEARLEMRRISNERFKTAVK